jgi:AraC-like DNA-binding protein
MIESLSGYLSRLACAHAVSPGTLTLKEMFPLLPRATRMSAQTPAHILANSHLLNGMGVVAQDWVAVVEKCTGFPNLGSLTMLPWKGVFAEQGLLRDRRTWCAYCYQEWNESGHPIYEPLLWQIKSVSTCIAHQRFLVDSCAHCGRKSLVLSRRSRPGHCARCQQWLGIANNDAAQPSVKNSRQDLDGAVLRTRMIAAMVAETASLRTPPGIGILRRNLQHCIDDLAHGNLSAFGRAAGVSNDTLRNWLKTSLPELCNFVRFCCELALPLVDFIAWPLALEARRQSIREILMLHETRRALSRNRALDALRDALNDNTALSLEEIAQKLGYQRTMQLYRYNSAACKTITRRHRAMAAAIRVQPRQGHSRRVCKFISTFELTKTLRAALKQDPAPSLGEVASGLKISKQTLHRRLPALCRSITKRFRSTWLISMRKSLQKALKQERVPTLRRLCSHLGIDRDAMWNHCPDLCRDLLQRFQHDRQEERERTQEILASALTEDIPPNIKLLAQSTGHSAHTLNSWFPKLFRKLAARSAKHNHILKAQNRAIVEAACREYPPPSVASVAARVRMNRNHLMTTFSSLGRRIADRRRRACEKNRRLFRQEVHHAVRKLSKIGKYPSVERVRSLIPTSPLRGNRLIARELKRMALTIQG